MIGGEVLRGDAGEQLDVKLPCRLAVGVSGPGALIGGKVVRGKVTPSRTSEKIGKKPGEIAAFRLSFFIFPSMQPDSNLIVNRCLPVSCGDFATGTLMI